MLGRHLLYQSGLPIPVGEKWTFTSNGSWVAPANGNYKITLVGAGGKGGTGCTRKKIEEYDYDSSRRYCYVCSACGSASGGGGGAGQTIVQTHMLRKDAELTITIGKPNSNPSKISGVISLTANGGDSGGAASTDGRDCPRKVYAGGVAAKYGTGGSGGYVSGRDNHSPTGGAGKVSDYGNGYGQGGGGGYGEWNNGTFHTGYNGTAGICVIEYLGRR